MMLASLWHQSAAAQQPVPEASGATAKFAIEGFDLTGDLPIKTEDAAKVLAPFVGPNASMATLQQATTALEDELKASGFSLHRVSLPPQEVGARVTLHVVKFVIAKITVEGNSRYSEANIRSSLPELREGEAPNFRTLSVQTTIANENQGKQVQVALKESREADKVDVTLAVKESLPWNLSASLSNTGSESTGRDRLTVVGGHSNVFDQDHQFAGAYTTSLERISDVKQLGLNYRIPMYRQGGVIGLIYTNSTVVGNFGTFNSTGAGQTVGFNYTHYLPPDGGSRSFLNLGLDAKRFNAPEINGAASTPQAERNSLPLSLGYTSRVESDTANWGYNTELALNLPGGAGNDLQSYQSEDPRISTSQWTALRGGGNYLSALASGWLWRVRGQFQLSADALIAGEQFGLGGVSSVRGTEERAISGDSGLSASLELTSPELWPGLRTLGFVDAGWLRNHNSEENPNKPASDSLASIGLGLRYSSNHYSVALDWAYVVSGSVLSTTSGSGIPQTGDQKLNFNFSARF